LTIIIIVDCTLQEPPRPYPRACLEASKAAAADPPHPGAHARRLPARLRPVQASANRPCRPGLPGRAGQLAAGSRVDEPHLPRAARTGHRMPLPSLPAVYRHPRLRPRPLPPLRPRTSAARRGRGAGAAGCEGGGRSGGRGGRERGEGKERGGRGKRGRGGRRRERGEERPWSQRPHSKSPISHTPPYHPPHTSPRHHHIAPRPYPRACLEASKAAAADPPPRQQQRKPSYKVINVERAENSDTQTY
jgi:hypothetical protein